MTGSTLGRFVLAGFADKIGRRNALVMMYAGVGLMDLVWLWAGSLEVLYLFAVVYGLFVMVASSALRLRSVPTISV